MPQSHPLTSANMNYTIQVMGCVTIGMILPWAFEGWSLFQPPSSDEYITPEPLEELSVDPEVVIYEAVPHKVQPKDSSTEIVPS